LHGGQLAGLHQLGELRRLLEALGITRRIGDDLGALQLPDEIVGGGLGGLGEGPRREEIRQLRGGQGQQAGSQHTPARRMRVRGLGDRLHRVVVAHVVPLTVEE
jgi:hypothetical protein